MSDELRVGTLISQSHSKDRSSVLAPKTEQLVLSMKQTRLPRSDPQSCSWRHTMRTSFKMSHPCKSSPLTSQVMSMMSYLTVRTKSNSCVPPLETRNKRRRRRRKGSKSCNVYPACLTLTQFKHVCFVEFLMDVNWKRCLFIFFYSFFMQMCQVCVCVCVCERENMLNQFEVILTNLEISH